MNTHTHLEDVSNEIFFEIFDYLHALDIFTGFTTLNRRISFILQSIPLHIMISQSYCRRQIDFLSSYLTYHAHQVISLKIHDTIRDYSSVISLLFNRHSFINLRSCKFFPSNPSTKLKNVIKKIQSLDRLVIFGVYHPNINETDKCDLTQIMLMHKSPFLRSMVLHYRYDYLDISNYTSISLNLTSLHLLILIHCTSSTGSLHPLLSIFRVCQRIRHLGITVEFKYSVQNNNINVPVSTQSLNDNDHPILPHLISFNLIICVICDMNTIAYMLHCMPNLNRFNFLLAGQITIMPYHRELFNGYVWQQVLQRYVPCLSKFEFDMSVWKSVSTLNFDGIVNSFQYFVHKYPNWHMVIDRWRVDGATPEEYVVLRTLNYSKSKSSPKMIMPHIKSESFETRSTTITNDHHLFYSDIRYLGIYQTKTRPTVTWSSPLYKKVNYLFVQVPVIPYSSLRDKLLNTVIFGQTADDDVDAQENVTDLLYFVHLPSVTELEFASGFRICQWKRIQFILQACPNLTDITISTQLLMLSKFIDNPSLIPIFKQITMIKSVTEKCYFLSTFASKLVRRFSSLIDIELQVFSFDNCVSIINVFLTYLENLFYVKIYYCQDSLLDDPFTRDYIIEKRSQHFANKIINEEKVIVKNNGEVIEIWLT